MVVGGKEKGKAVITAMSSNGKYATCEVSNTARDLPAQSVKITGKYFSAGTAKYTMRTAATGIIGGDIFDLEAVMDPKYSTDSLVWTTSNSSVVSLVTLNAKKHTCTLRANGNGTAVITVQAKDNTGNVHAETTVELTMDLRIPVSYVLMRPMGVIGEEASKFKMNAYVYPEDAADRSVTWKSSDPSVATVSSDGTVTFVKKGKAVITVTTNDGGYTATCDVEVIPRKDPVEAFVVRMYRVCLLRLPDETGFRHWVSQLKSRTLTGGQVAYEFFFSNEMINRNLSDSDYLDRAYEAIMGREPDAGGKKFWLDRLNVGFSRKAIICGFIQSNEFGNICSQYGITRGTVALTEARDMNYGATAFASRLYTKILGRKYDVTGLNYWCAIIMRNPSRSTLLQVALSGFIHSNEFQAKKLNDTDFLKVMYRTFLDREAEPGGLQYWLGKIYSGMSRDDVAAGFAASNEFRNIMAQFGFN